jgi:hypothetical protein
MADFVSEQKLMKTREFSESEQMLIITKGLAGFWGRNFGELSRFPALIFIQAC